MATMKVSGQRVHTARSSRVAVAAAVLAALLFLSSAVLQLTASLERWVVFRGSLSGSDISAEDHLYDYTVPMDPWQPIGDAAQLYGTGLLLTALGVLVLPLCVRIGQPFRRRGIATMVIIGETLVAFLVAGSLAVDGAHALLSGITGTPSLLQNWGALGWIGVVGLIVLILLWRRSPAVVIACVFLFGSTGVGYLVAAFFIAPMISGMSHDTAPWTETVVAASTAGAGITMAVAAWSGFRRTPPTSL